MVTRYRSLMLLAAVLFTQLLVMAYQLRRNRDIPVVRNAVVYVVAPVQRGMAGVVHSFQSVWEGYVALWGTHRQNQALSREIDGLKLENQRLREQAEQGRRLQVLFDLREQFPLPTIAAQVLSAGSSEAAQIVMIDKGANDGLKPDLPVLVPDGVVGKILHVFSDTAQVLLVTDPYSGVASLLEESRVHGILKGQNKPFCLLTYVPNGDEVKAGQIVFTSGEDQIYPKGLPLGVVMEARPGPEFQQILVRPLAPLNRLEEVLVILQSGGDIGKFPLASTSPSGGAAAETARGPNAQPAAPPPSAPRESLASPAFPGNLPQLVPAAPTVPGPTQIPASSPRNPAPGNSLPPTPPPPVAPPIPYQPNSPPTELPQPVSQ